MNYSTNHRYIIVSPVYNEALNVTRFLNSLFLGVRKANENGYICSKIVLCINGCSDNSECLIKENSLFINGLIDIIYSEKGYMNAVVSLFEYVKSLFPNDYIIKCDSDSEVADESITAMLNCISNDSKLIMVGGIPQPLINYASEWYRDLFAKIMYISSAFPELKKAKYNSKYDEYYNRRRDRIFAHGRFFILKSAQYFYREKDQLGDDVFLNAEIYTRFGPGVIDLCWDAICRYRPYSNMSSYRRAKKRINEDLAILSRKKRFQWYIDASRLNRNWNYFFINLPFAMKMYYVLYVFISNTMKRSFPFFKYKSKYRTYHIK